MPCQGVCWGSNDVTPSAQGVTFEEVPMISEPQVLCVRLCDTATTAHWWTPQALNKASIFGGARREPAAAEAYWLMFLALNTNRDKWLWTAVYICVILL